MESTFNLLKGKTAIITGCASGIGLSTMELFATCGADVMSIGITKGSLDEVSARLSKEHSVSVIPYYFDISSYDSVKNFYSMLVKENRKVDILINNAGILRDALIPMITEEILKKTYEVNVFGSIFMMQYASRMMMRQKSGSIVNISSIIGTHGNEGQVVYAGSKAALIGVTKSASKELAGYNIRVNAIAPGFIDTKMSRSIPEEKFNERLTQIKMGRIGSPVDVAQCALFLSSDLSSYITGEVIGVDGEMII